MSVNHNELTPIVGPDPLPNWAPDPSNDPFNRNGFHISTLNQTHFYTRSLTQPESGNAFIFEAVLNVTPVPASGSDETSDARIGLRFLDSASGEHWVVEVRFITGPGGVLRIALVDTAVGEVERAHLERNFSSPTRVRLRRQEIGGVDYLFLEAEAKSTFEDKDKRGEDGSIQNEREPVPLADFNLQWGAGYGAIAWGHTADNHSTNSWWESVHVTFCDDKTSLLPYWPPDPPTPPTVSFDDQGTGNPQQITVEANVTGDFVTGDVAYAELDATPAQTPGADQTPPGLLAWTFPGLDDDQIVTGSVFTRDPAGRKGTIVAVQQTIPDRTAPTIFVVWPPLPDPVKNGDNLIVEVQCDADDYTVEADFSNVDSNASGWVLGSGPGFARYTIEHTIDLANTTVDGTYSIPIRLTDLAGNLATDSSAEVTLDNTAPSPPVITDPLTGAYLNTQTPTISGSAAPGAKVRVLDGAILRGSVTADPTSGLWSLVSSTLPPGTRSLTATAEDAAGNLSGPSSPPVIVDIDLTAPTGQIQVTLVSSISWHAPNSGDSFNEPIAVAILVPMAAYQDLDHNFAGNPGGSTNGQSKLLITPPGGEQTIYHLDEASLFSVEPVGPEGGPTHWRFVFRDGGVDPVSFKKDGVIRFQAYLQDFAGNNATIPAGLPLELNLAIPPEGDIAVDIGITGGYAAPPVSGVITTLDVDVGILSDHDDIDPAASWVQVEEGGGTFQLDPDPPTPYGSRFLYKATAARITADGEYTLTAHIQDAAGNVGTISATTNPQLVDTTKPTGECRVGLAATGPFEPNAGTYPTGELWIAVAVPDSITDLDEEASTFQVGAAAAITLASVAPPLSQPPYNCYVWPSALTTADTYPIEYQLVDTPAGQTLGPQQCQLTIGQPSFSIVSSGIRLSHSHDDGTNTDPNNKIHNGTESLNYMGVRVYNGGQGPGNCMYRLFVVPNYVFGNPEEWLMVDEGDPAPMVSNVAANSYKNSTGNRNFQQGSHPEFPEDSELFNGGGVGSVVHTCTAAILHSPSDPLRMKDSSGTWFTLTNEQFNNPDEFKAKVMGNMAGAASGSSYWEAVKENSKIANRNFNFVKVV